MKNITIITLISINILIGEENLKSKKNCLSVTLKEIRSSLNESGFIGLVEYEFTIKELAEKVISMIQGCTSKIIYEPLPGDDPKQRRANNNLAKEKLGREPKIGLDEGLGKTVEYFRRFI